MSFGDVAAGGLVEFQQITVQGSASDDGILVVSTTQNHGTTPFRVLVTQSHFLDNTVSGLASALNGVLTVTCAGELCLGLVVDVQESVFQRNSAAIVYGPTLAVLGAGALSASVSVVDSVFSDNNGQMGAGLYVSSPGAITESSIVVSGCSFTNQSVQSGGGGAVAVDTQNVQDLSLIVENCSFVDCRVVRRVCSVGFLS